MSDAGRDVDMPCVPCMRGSATEEEGSSLVESDCVNVVGARGAS